MSTTAPTQRSKREPPARLLTIGAVCRGLKSEFPDISISKIRYLEDQGLIHPKRTQGGYRLFGEEDVERLRRILQLQRDEFLPLRVIRDELASAGAKDRVRRRALAITEAEDEVTEEELQRQAGVTPDFVRELEGFGLLAPRTHGGERLYRETDVDVATACAQLARFGLAPRNLRVFRTAADRNAGLVEAVVAPALRSSRPERRQAGAEDLQALAELAQELSSLLFWRELRTGVNR
jgi:DNA-binding transcriptional MerR regulator